MREASAPSLQLGTLQPVVIGIVGSIKSAGLDVKSSARLSGVPEAVQSIVASVDRDQNPESVADSGSHTKEEQKKSTKIE